MLSLMRRNAGSWLIKGILAVIVIVFVFWGVGSYGQMRANRAATVDGQTITRLDFQNAYNSIMRQAQNTYGADLNEEILRSLNVEQQALTSLINETVLMQTADKMGLLVSDDELRQSIYNIPAFQNNGTFDPNLYMMILNNMRVSNEAFEESQRMNLVVNKLRNLVAADVKVSDAEVLEWYQWSNRRISAKYVQLQPAGYNVEAADSEIAAYYNVNLDKYMTLPMRKIVYAKFAPADYLDEVNVTDEEIEEFYLANLEEYAVPAQMDLSHIVVRISDPGNEGAEDAAKARIDEVAAKLAEGADFDAMVQEYSEEIAKEDNGHLGIVPKADLAELFGEEVANLSVGDFSKPVKSDFFWHIFKVNSVDDAKTVTFDEVKDILQTELALNYARNMAYDAAEEVAGAVFAGEDLNAAADGKGVAAVNTDYFDRGTLINSLDLQQRSAFTDFIFAYEVGDVSNVEEFEGDYYVAVILDEKAPEQIPLENVREVVKQTVIAEKQGALAAADAMDIIKAVQGGQSLEDAAAKYDVEVQYTPALSRYESIPGLGGPGSLLHQAVFGLNASRSVVEEPLPGPTVLAFNGSSEAAMDNYETEAMSIRMQLLQQKQEEVFASFINKQILNSKIFIADDFRKFYNQEI